MQKKNIFSENVRPKFFFALSLFEHHKSHVVRMELVNAVTDCRTAVVVFALLQESFGTEEETDEVGEPVGLLVHQT